MKKNLLGAGIIYSIGQLLVKGVSFVLIPLYSKKLGSSIYGQLSLVDMIYSLIGMFIIFSIYSGYMRFYNDDIEKKAFPTAINFSLISILIQGLIFIILGKYFSNLILRLENSYFILLLIFFRGALDQIISLLQVDYTLEYKAKKVIIINTIHTATNILFIIYLVVIKDLKVEGIYLGNIMGNIIILCYLLYDNRKKFKLILDKYLLKEMFKFSSGLLLGNISYLILAMGDRYFLAEYKTFSDVGIYSMGYKFATLIEIIYITPFKRVATPYKFEIYKEKDCDIKFNKLFNFYNILSGLFFLIISLNIKIILVLFTTEEFIISYKITSLIVFSYILYGQAMFYCIGIQIKNKTYLDSFIMISGGLSNIILNFYFVKNFGMYGAAISTILSYIIMMCCYIKISLPMFYIKFDFNKMLKIFVLMFSLYGIYFILSLQNINIFIETILGNLLILLYLFIVYKLIITNEEKKEILEFLNDKIPYLNKFLLRSKLKNGDM